jgi:hypothetical protein
MSQASEASSDARLCGVAQLSTLPEDSVEPLLDATTLSIGLEATEAPSLAPPRLAGQLFRWGMIVGEFGAVQIGVQLIGAIAGFIIVRSLAKPEYALYAVANAGLSMFNMLADTGISPALRSIGGEVHGDRASFSQLVATARYLRHLFSGIALLISVPVTAWMLLANGAGALQTAALCGAVLASCWPLLTSTVLREAALMLGKYRKVQVADITTSAVRLTCILVAYSHLSSILGMVFTALANWAQWLVYRRRSSDDVDVVAPTTGAQRQRVLMITWKMLPNVLFFCFQGQLTFLLLTVLGTTTGLADVAALGRLSALLTIFSAVFNNVLAPRFARCQNLARLPGLYLGLLGVAAAALLPVAAFAWYFPDLLLMILGSSYAGLERECFLMVAAGCLAQLGGAMVWLNFSRAWIRIYHYANIPAILLAQAGSAMLFNLGTVRGVLLFSIVSAIAPLPVYALDACLGLKFGTAQGSKVGGP